MKLKWEGEGLKKQGTRKKLKFGRESRFETRGWKKQIKSHRSNKRYRDIFRTKSISLITQGSERKSWRENFIRDDEISTTKWVLQNTSWEEITNLRSQRTLQRLVYIQIQIYKYVHFTNFIQYFSTKRQLWNKNFVIGKRRESRGRKKEQDETQKRNSEKKSNKRDNNMWKELHLPNTHKSLLIKWP